MKTAPALAVAALTAALAPAADPPKPFASGLTRPTAVAVAADGKVYVTAAGGVFRIDNGKAAPVVSGLGDPRGLAAYRQWLFVADRDRVVRVEAGGKTDPFAPPNAFPVPPQALTGVAVDPESGTVYVCDAGDGKGAGGAVYRVTPNGLVGLVTDARRVPGLHTPAGLVLNGASFLLVADAGTGTLYRVRIADGSAERVADGLGAVGGLCWDWNGRLFAADGAGGKLFGVNRPGDKPVELPHRFGAAAGLAFDPAADRLLVADPKAGAVVAVPATVPGAEVDTTPLALQPALAFPNLTWTGWEPETEAGKANPFRPIVLTHAGDGTNRVFVATEQGVIHVFPNDQGAKQTKVFLDLRDRVKYSDQTNEEGFLGLAFHPRYKETGEFFVFYTPKQPDRANRVARFRVGKDDPDKADPGSEQEVYLFKDRPFWNHDGGTVCFGPDGMLYVVHGDGGAGNDPFDNAQNLARPLGKILRLDVDHKVSGKNYAVPKDNPFVGRTDALPEVWAYGLRNVWRMAFDRKTGQLWAADVGQNLFEEINLIRRGGNYGWNRREGLHPFGGRGSGPRPEFVEPIWEYHHDVGKSLTGGVVYRGKRLPELDGHYLYADYVTAKLWALKYDEAKARVVANRPIPDKKRAVYSFGEDEAGEVYFLSLAGDGKGVFWFTKK